MVAPVPTLADTLRRAVEHHLEGVHTSMPGVVVSYDHATQTATIRPTVRQLYHDPAAGQLVSQAYPDLPHVPILFPAAAAAALTFELAAGDPVILLFGEASTDEWRNGAAEDNTPVDPRRFDLSDAVAIPGGRPVGSTDYAAGATVLRANDIRLGSSAASDFVALSSRVLAELQSIFSQLVAHTHGTGVGPTTPAIGVTVAPTSVAATKVKAE